MVNPSFGLIQIPPNFFYFFIQITSVQICVFSSILLSLAIVLIFFAKITALAMLKSHADHPWIHVLPVGS